MGAPQQKTSGSSGLMTATVLAAAGAGAYYYHKDMTKEELREAGEGYVAKTKEAAGQAYETTKSYSQAGYAKIMSLIYPETEQEIDHTTFEEPSAPVVEEEAEVEGEQTYMYEEEVEAEQAEVESEL